ncbi:MAG: hypothetical protein AAF829_09650 [Pseudomonadota bacterium]
MGWDWNKLFGWLHHVEPDLSRFLGFVSLISFGFASTQFTAQGDPRGILIFSLGLFFITFAIRTLERWPALKAALCDGDDPDEQRIASSFDEPFVLLVALLWGMSAFIFLGNEQRLGPANMLFQGDLTNFTTTLATVSSIILFLPLTLLFFLFTKTEMSIVDQRSLELGIGDFSKRTFFRHDVFSKLTFTVSVIALSGIVLLAWAAGEDKFSISDDLGIWITATVMLCFIGMIASPHALKALNQFHEDRGNRESVATSAAGWAISPIASASYIDSALVRLVAPLSGATLTGAVWKPYAALIGTILPLSALGYGLPAPYGLIPLGLAMIIVLALGRRWAWVEEDRELATRIRTTRGPAFHIGFRNDLKDEALLGYACFFFLVPLVLNQLQDWTPAFEVVAAYSAGNGFVDWLRFFGAELAKAVPFVDWWEIYDVDVRVPFEPSETSPFAKHLTFGARAIVDLVIMAALIQAFSLWQRGQTQKRLFQEGQVDAFDPFTELDFFDRGFATTDRPGLNDKPDIHSLRSLQAFTIEGPNGKFYRAKAPFIGKLLKHIEKRKELGFDPAPYNRRRLGELRHEREDDLKYGSLWLMEAFDVLAGTPVEQLSGFVGRLHNLQIRPMDDQSLRVLRREAERIVSELTVTKSRLNADPLTDLVFLLASFEARTEFDTLRDSIIVLLEEQKTYQSAVVLAGLVLPNFTEKPEHMVFAVKRQLKQDRLQSFEQTLMEAHFRRAPMREAAYYALSRMAEAADQGQGAKATSDWVGEVLQVAASDQGDQAHQSARQVADKLSNDLSSRADEALDEQEDSTGDWHKS